jgi:hypothetical protein
VYSCVPTGIQLYTPAFNVVTFCLTETSHTVTCRSAVSDSARGSFSQLHAGALAACGVQPWLGSGSSSASVARYLTFFCGRSWVWHEDVRDGVGVARQKLPWSVSLLHPLQLHGAIASHAVVLGYNGLQPHEVKLLLHLPVARDVAHGSGRGLPEQGAPINLHLKPSPAWIVLVVVVGERSTSSFFCIVLVCTVLESATCILNCHDALFLDTHMIRAEPASSSESASSSSMTSISKPG